MPGGGEIALKGVADAGARMGAWIQPGAGSIMIDGVAVAFEANDSLDRICLIREAPAGLKKLVSLNVSARFRYSVGMKPATIPLSMNSYNKIPDVPYMAYLSGQQLYFMANDRGRAGGPALEDFVDIESIAVIGKDGKETKVTQSPGATARGQQYMFELKDIKLRD
jgi:hypothetical protein